MKRVLFLISAFLILLLPQSRAQDSIFYSSSFRFSKNMAIASCIQPNDNGFIMVEATQDKTPKIHIIQYDVKGNLLNEYQHSLNIDSEENIQVEKITPLDSMSIIFLSAFDRKANTCRAYAATILENGKIISTPKMIHASPAEQPSTLQVNISPDKSRLLFHFQTETFRKAETPIHFTITDARFNVIQNKELYLPYGSEVAQVQQCLVDDSSNVFLMSGKNPLKNNVRVVRSQGGRYLVFYYNFKENKLKEYDISLKDKQVVAALGALNSKNEMIVGGYYSNDFSFAVAGSFVFRISAGGLTLKNASYMALPKDFLSQFISGRELDRYPELADFFLDHMIIQDNGSILLIGEKYTLSERVNMDPVTGRTIIENLHHYDDIIIHNLMDNGKINWLGYIPKAQHSSLERDKCGYNYFISKNDIRFYFNDHPDNFKALQNNPRARIDSWNGSRSAVISEVVFDANGSTTRKNLVSHKAAGGVLIPGLSSEQTLGNIVLGLSQNKDYKFCILR